MLLYDFSFNAMKYVLAQIRGWKVWEQETASHDYEFSNGMLFNELESANIFLQKFV